MKRHLDLIGIVGAMIGVSAVLYAAEYAIFGEPGTIASQTLHELAFLPIHALVVVLIFEGLLARRENRSILHKLNMVIGGFFSESGTQLLKRLAAFDEDLAGLAPALVFKPDWRPGDFDRARRAAVDRPHHLHASPKDLVEMRDLLSAQRPFLLGLLENANLLEYEGFSEMLWALTHLSEELLARPGFENLPATDVAHIQTDMARAYGRLLAEWLRYAEHLKTDYPYLFSFAVRTNPFDPDAAVEVTD